MLKENLGFILATPGQSLVGLKNMSRGGPSWSVERGLVVTRVDERLRGPKIDSCSIVFSIKLIFMLSAH